MFYCSKKITKSNSKLINQILKLTFCTYQGLAQEYKVINLRHFYFRTDFVKHSIVEKQFSSLGLLEEVAH